MLKTRPRKTVADYMRLPEYWLVDINASSVEVLKVVQATYQTHGYFEVRDTLESPTLAGLSVPVATFFAGL